MEQLEQERLIKEADMSQIADVFQTLWNLASAGFISYQFAKAVYNSYKSGKKTEDEIEDMVQGLTIDFLRNGEDDDLDHLEKTMPYNMHDFDKTVDHEIDFDDTVELERRSDDTAVLDRDGAFFDIEDGIATELDFDSTLPIIELDPDEADDVTGSTQIRSGRRGDTKRL
jgi:hypothetical protein